MSPTGLIHPRLASAENRRDGGDGSDDYGTPAYGIFSGAGFGFDQRMIGRAIADAPASQRRQYPRGPKGYERSPGRIHEDICERLLHALHIDSSDVSVHVEQGTVTLEGTVPTRRMKYAIEDIAADCPGVQDVDNRIRVVRDDER